MLVKAGVNLSKVRWLVDPTYNPLLLVHGSFSALQAYQSNEPITLRADHKPFTMWTPAQFGIPGTFNVQVVNRKFLASHPTASADFLRAEFLAFNYCVHNPVTCVDYLAKAQGLPSTLRTARPSGRSKAVWRSITTSRAKGSGLRRRRNGRPKPLPLSSTSFSTSRQAGAARGHRDRGLALPRYAAHLALEGPLLPGPAGTRYRGVAP